ERQLRLCRQETAHGIGGRFSQGQHPYPRSLGTVRNALWLDRIVSAKRLASQPGVGPKTMPSPQTRSLDVPNTAVVLLTGATGYVGGKLIPLLEQQPVVLRCLARTPDKLRRLVG